MKNVWYYNFPIGRLAIACDSEGITDIAMGTVDAVEKRTKIIDKAAEQLNEYFLGIRREFDIPLSIHGTDFQKRVWNALRNIPYGETRSYGDIALAIGNPRACRAVGMANNRNRIMIVIPCHRVIGSDGSLVGYGGGLDIKKKLLEIEHTCS